MEALVAIFLLATISLSKEASHRHLHSDLVFTNRSQFLLSTTVFGRNPPDYESVSNEYRKTYFSVDDESLPTNFADDPVRYDKQVAHRLIEHGGIDEDEDFPEYKEENERYSHHKRRRKRADLEEKDDRQGMSGVRGRGGQSSGEVNFKLEEFVTYFVEQFEAKLNAYKMISEIVEKHEGMSSKLLKELGTGDGMLSFFLGSNEGRKKAGKSEGSDKLGSSLGSSKRKKKFTKLYEVMDLFLKYKTKFREELVIAGFDVFQSFELQFMRVSANVKYKETAMQLLSEDAANRAINYYNKNKGASVTAGVVLGESKTEPVSGETTSLVKVMSNGYEINYKFESTVQKWRTSNLYKKVGLVILGKTPRENTYHKKKSSKSDADKYGYRRLFTSENWNKLKDKYEFSTVWNQFKDYKYILSSNDLVQKSKDIIEKINKLDGEGFSEDRIRKIIEDVKHDVIKEMNVLKKRKVGEDRRKLRNIEVYLKSLEVEYCLKLYNELYKKDKHNYRKTAKSETGGETGDVLRLESVYGRKEDERMKIQNPGNEEMLIEDRKITPKYNKRKGTSGISGQMYEIDLAMFFLLQGIGKKENGEIGNFYLASNMKEAGDFDDVVLKITGGELENSKVIFLQAKHKDSPENDNAKISINRLLSEPNKKDMFTLRDYFSSYLKVKEEFSKEINKGHPIFESSFKDCEFIIYTNALPNFQFKENHKNVKKINVDEQSFMNIFKGNHYYQLTLDGEEKINEKIRNVLRSSSECNKLAKELAKTILPNEVNKSPEIVNQGIVKKYQVSLAEKVIKTEKAKSGAFREEFLEGDESLSPEDRIFRDAFLEEILKRNEFSKTKSQLREMNIKLADKFGEASGKDANIPLPSDLIGEDDIREFLKKLKLYIDQPNESKLSEIIKQKIQSAYRVDQHDVDMIFSDVESKVQIWWKDKDEYLTENNKFFQESIRVSITFDVQEPVELFTGREDELRELHRIIRHSSGEPTVITQMTSISGLGGVGKSELARRYIQKHSKDYDNNIIWINAENAATLTESFLRLAKDKLRIKIKDADGKQKHIKSIVEDVYKFLGKRRSLFVFDNADNFKSMKGKEDLDIHTSVLHSSLPSNMNKPKFLVTSRNQRWGNIKVLKLDVFPEGEAKEFIRKALVLDDGEQENEVERLANTLQRFPLALQQAVAYIKERNLSLRNVGLEFDINDYLKRYEKETEELLSFEFPQDSSVSYTKTTFTTWKITIETIKKNEKYGRIAKEILDVISYLASDSIPVEMFNALKEIGGDKEKLGDAVQILKQYSMVNSGQEQSLINVHKLVQQVTRIEVASQKNDENAIRNAFEILKNSYPYGGNQLEDYSKKRLLLPHMEAFLSNLDDWVSRKSEIKNLVEVDYIQDLLNWMGDGYEDIGNHKRQKVLLKRLLEAKERLYGTDDIEVASTLNNLANAYVNLGDNRMAKDLLERALKISEEYYNPDDILVAITLNNLGNAYGGLGDSQKKKELLEKALKFKEKYYEPDDFQLAIPLHNLGDIYVDFGDNEKAKDLLERALKIKEKYYGPDHFQLALTLTSLGTVYIELGKNQMAKDLLERALKINEEYYGPDHFQVALTLLFLGNAYGFLGDNQKKKDFLERALKINEEYYGPDHFQVAITLENLGNAYGELDDIQKKKDLLERALRIKEIYYGPDNFQVASTLVNLGNTYGVLGDNKMKIEFLEKALKIQQRYHGPDHFQVAITLNNLGNAYADLGDNQKAKDILERALKIKEKCYGPVHFEVAITLTSLGTVYIELGKNQMAKDLLERALKINEEYYGPDDFQVALTLLPLGNAYGFLGDNQKKKDLLERALKINEEYYGPDHSQVALFLVFLGKVYGDLGDNQKENDVYQRALPILDIYYPAISNELRRGLNLEVNLRFACENGDLDLVKNLIEKGSDVLERDDHDTVLHQAVSSGSRDVITFLLNKIREIDPQHILEHIDAPDNEGDTPLMWAAENGRVDATRVLLEYGAGVNIQNNDGETALHWAVKGGHQEVVMSLLDSEIDPNIKDKNGKTPLDLAQEMLTKHPEDNEVKTVAGLLLSLADESKLHHQEEQVSGSVSSEKCLSVPSSGSRSRKKRELRKGECNFSWEDVDEINVDEQKRDFNRIIIDSDKFIDYLKRLSEKKRGQLIGLAHQVNVIGNSKSAVNELIGIHDVMTHLNRAGRVSALTMQGMMAKNALADFLNDNYEGVAVNVGFIAGGQGFARVAKAASIKGLELSSEGKLLLGRSLKAASPFLARGTSAFVAYDLVNQIKRYRKGDSSIGIISDGVYLGVDAIEIGVEIAEAFQVLEGVSSVTGPIGATIGALVFVGTDVYEAVERVEKIDQLVHLRRNERFVEGLRAFFGMKPEKHIQVLMEEKEVSDVLVTRGYDYLRKHGEFKHYVFPTGRTVVDSCRKVPYQTSVCASGGFGGRCFKVRKITRYAEECSTKFQTDLDNWVLLDRKRDGIKWKRIKPDNPSGGQLFCLPQGNYDFAPNYGSFLCKSAIGISDLSKNKTGNYTLINLGEGEDYGKGFKDSPNIFLVNNGSKTYYGGNEDDVFILQGSGIKGYFNGGNGVNTLDLTSFAMEKDFMDMKLHIGRVEGYSSDYSFGIDGINKIIGRRANGDNISITCDRTANDIKFVDGQGGNDKFRDHILIYDRNCSYEMHIVVRPNTVIYNHALKGRFHYTIPFGVGSAEVKLFNSDGILNVSNIFFFEYEVVDIRNISVRNSNILNKTFNAVTFQFSTTLEENINITIYGASNSSYKLGNWTEIKIGNKDNMYMLKNTNESVDEIIKCYLVVSKRLKKMSFFIKSLLSNEIIAIGSGNHVVLCNDPGHKSHLVGNGGENVYLIDSGDDKMVDVVGFRLPEVIIYSNDIEPSMDTIDLRNLVQKITKFSSKGDLELQIVKSGTDLILKGIGAETIPESKVVKVQYFIVRLKEGINLYKKTRVILNNVPLKIVQVKDEWKLKPFPLLFEMDKEIIVVTSKDVVEDDVLVTPRRAGNYSFVRDKSYNLMLTNAFDKNIPKSDLCTVIFINFYREAIMGTLTIKFADKEVDIKYHQKQIGSASYDDFVKMEFKKKVYSEVFKDVRSKSVNP